MDKICLSMLVRSNHSFDFARIPSMLGLKNIDTSDEESKKALPDKGKILIGVIVGSKASVQDKPFEITSA